MVDDNTLTLPGFVQAVDAAPELELVAGFGHDDALAWTGDWAAVDALVVDAADEDRPGDQFPGVAVVRHVRAAIDAGDHGPVVVVVTGHYLHDGLRHRMAAAGADFFFLRSDLRSPGALVDVVLHPDGHRRGVPSPADRERLGLLGVGRGADVERFVSWVDERGLGPDLAGDGGRAEPRSRRWGRIRKEAAGAGGIEPVNLTTGNQPRGQHSPSIRQLGRLWQWAARVRGDDR